MSPKHRTFSAHPYTSPLCTRTHQIAALVLVTATFFFTRLFDQSFPPSTCYTDLDRSSPSLNLHVAKTDSAGHQPGLSEDTGPTSISRSTSTTRTRSTAKKNSCTDETVPFQQPLVSKASGALRLLLESRFRTREKEEADLFFVPAYAKCVRMTGGLSDKEINQTYVKVLSQMPYFRRSGGRDHIFVFPSGAGAHLFRSWATYINRSIVLTPEGDRTDKKDVTAFNTWKDIIIPGNVDDGMTKTGATVFQPWPLSKRKYLANYLGRAEKKVGQLKLIELAKQYPEKLECPELQFSGPNKLGRLEYFQHLGNAKICLAPVFAYYLTWWTLYQNQTTELCICLSDEVIKQIIARGRQLRCLWVYAPDSEPCSTMRALMWEIQRKVRQFHQSTETFWLHNRSVVNRDLVEFANWKPPVPRLKNCLPLFGWQCVLFPQFSHWLSNT